MLMRNSIKLETLLLVSPLLPNTAESPFFPYPDSLICSHTYRYRVGECLQLPFIYNTPRPYSLTQCIILMSHLWANCLKVWKKNRVCYMVKVDRYQSRAPGCSFWPWFVALKSFFEAVKLTNSLSHCESMRTCCSDCLHDLICTHLMRLGESDNYLTSKKLSISGLYLSLILTVYSLLHSVTLSVSSLWKYVWFSKYRYSWSVSSVCVITAASVSYTSKISCFFSISKKLGETSPTISTHEKKKNKTRWAAVM